MVWSGVWYEISLTFVDSFTVGMGMTARNIRKTWYTRNIKYRISCAAAGSTRKIRESLQNRVDWCLLRMSRRQQKKSRSTSSCQKKRIPAAQEPGLGLYCKTIHAWISRGISLYGFVALL